MMMYHYAKRVKLSNTKDKDYRINYVSNYRFFNIGIICVRNVIPFPQEE